MSKSKIITFSIAVIFFLIFAANYISSNKYSFAGNKITWVKIESDAFKAEVVSSDQKMQKGLGERTDMCDKCGMLFEFQKAGKHSFWMKDMQIPLDIIWISEDKIVHIEKKVQPSFTGTLTPPEVADKVLEVNAGDADRFGIQTGDSVNF